jgi:broad specificity phosphatase PhoE
MRTVEVSRHGEKEIHTIATDGRVEAGLTKQGQMRARQLGRSLGPFDRVYSTSRGRAIETAQLLSGNEPIRDDRAGYLQLPKYLMRSMKERTHPLGTSGLVFEDPASRLLARVSGMVLVAFINEILQQLPEDGSALIVSHDIPMLAARQDLQKVNRTVRSSLDERFGYLEGFRVFQENANESLKLERV